MVFELLIGYWLGTLSKKEDPKTLVEYTTPLTVDPYSYETQIQRNLRLGI